MTNDNRAKLLERIRNISARTTDNGCTEAEALAAAEMLAKLLSEHGLSMTDVEIGEEKCQIGYLNTGRKTLHEVRWCGTAVAEFTDCKVWSARQEGSKTIAFFGLPGDVETAIYLMRVIKSSMDIEAPRYLARAKELGELTGRRASHAFLMGMARRVSQRLREIKSHERQASQSTGRDLVVIKSAVVRAQFAGLGIHLRSGSSRAHIGDNGAFAAGQAAGNNVSFNRGVGSNNATLALR
jgi:hypothetical protein